MKVEIWSDVACPFCWIGKRHFESAVERLGLEELEVEWKSFELDPQAKQNYEDDLYTLLASKYKQTREWALTMSDEMKQKGKSVGLEFNFENTIPTNTFQAHRLLHLAKTKGFQTKAEEALFEAYFTNGKHISERETLIELGMSMGIEESEIAHMLDSDQFAKEVREDELLGQHFGIRGVPFFAVNRKYGISGAQPVEHMMEVLTKAYREETAIALQDVAEGDACGVDGCD
jgi:predicted DsbA family dithiol-disulfide isomerase